MNKFVKVCKWIAIISVLLIVFVIICVSCDDSEETTNVEAIDTTIVDIVTTTTVTEDPFDGCIFENKYASIYVTKPIWTEGPEGAGWYIGFMLYNTSNQNLDFEILDSKFKDQSMLYATDYYVWDTVYRDSDFTYHVKIGDNQNEKPTSISVIYWISITGTQTEAGMVAKGEVCIEY